MKKILTKIFVMVLAFAFAAMPVLSYAEGVSKTAKWLDEDKESIEITIEVPELEDVPALFIGSNCSGHSLTAQAIYDSINKLAQFNNVEYVLHSLVSIEKSCMDANRAGNEQYAAGTLAKGESLSSTQKTAISGSLIGGGHNSVMCFANEICSHLENKSYSQIVMEFDSNYIFTGTDVPVSAEDKAVLHRAAELLAPYYADGRVIWVVASTAQTIKYISSPGTYTTVPSSESALPLHKGCYTSSLDEMTANFDLENAVPVKSMSNWSSQLGVYDRYNMYFGMALFDPATWLTGVDSSGEIVEENAPAWEDFTINSNFVFYNDRANIVKYLNDAFIYDTVKIQDTVNTALAIKGAVLETCDSTGSWKEIENSVITDENNITATATGDLIYTPLRLRITCEILGSFHDNHEPAETNVGNAVVSLQFQESEVSKFSVVSPKLLKDEKPVIKADDITVENGTQPDDIIAAINASASDAEDGDITSAVTVEFPEGFDPSIAGEYTVTVKVTDSDGNTTEKEIVVTVDSNEVPVITAEDSYDIPYGTSFEDAVASIGASAADFEDGDITASIVVSGEEDYNPEVPGEYTIVITVTDSDGNTVRKEVKLTVGENPNTGDSSYIFAVVAVVICASFVCVSVRKKENA